MKISESGYQIVIEEDMTISDSHDYKELLLNTLAKTDCLTVHFKPSVHIDVSCIQLLCASHIYCIKHQKKIEISGKTNQAVKSVLQTTGLMFCEKCMKDYRYTCIWQNGGC